MATLFIISFRHFPIFMPKVGFTLPCLSVYELLITVSIRAVADLYALTFG